MNQTKTLFFILLLSVLALSLFVNGVSNDAYACSCIAPDSPKKTLEKSDAVFSGKVAKIEEKHPNAEMYSSTDPVSVTFDVDTVWKGRHDDKITIHTAKSSASCGFEFEENQKYIVYATENENQLNVSLCSRTSLIENAGQDITEFGPGFVVKSDSILSPLKQFKSGIPIEKIQCKNDLILMQKYGGTPICVHKETGTKLVERGWMIDPIRMSQIGNQVSYLGLYLVYPYIESDKMVVSIEGRSDFVKQIVDDYNVTIISTKDTSNYSSIYGNVTKPNLERFFEENPMNQFLKKLSISSVGSFKDNSGEYGPFNQAPEEKMQKIGNFLRDYEKRKMKDEYVDWDEIIQLKNKLYQ